MNALHNLFLDSLAARYDAEKRLILAMPAIAKRSGSQDFRELIRRHFKETVDHAKKLEKVFQCFATDARSTECAITISLLEECDEIAAEYKSSPALHAALIACAQKIEHHEIASYGCLAEWAAVLGNKPAASLLRDILAEEKAADAALSYLARSHANDEALGEYKSTKTERGGSIAKPLNRRVGATPRTFNRIHPVLM
jgi:ferritin-like metal-binding protein YciE